MFVTLSYVLADIPSEWRKVLACPVDRCLVGDGGEGIVVGVHEAGDRSGAHEGADLCIGKV